MPSTPRSLATTSSTCVVGARITNGLITPGEMPELASASRPTIASPLPGKSFACASLGFSWKPKTSRTATIAAPTAATGHGRRTTSLPHLPQNPASGLVEVTRRFGITRRLLIRCPSSDSSAGSSVIETSTETAGISMPPIPIERMKGSGRKIMLNRPTATVEPETITERPACVIISTSAVSTSSPWASSSRKRKIIRSA